MKGRKARSARENDHREPDVHVGVRGPELLIRGDLVRASCRATATPARGSCSVSFIIPHCSPPRCWAAPDCPRPRGRRRGTAGAWCSRSCRSPAGDAAPGRAHRTRAIWVSNCISDGDRPVVSGRAAERRALSDRGFGRGRLVA